MGLPMDVHSVPKAITDLLGALVVQQTHQTVLLERLVVAAEQVAGALSQPSDDTQIAELTEQLAESQAALQRALESQTPNP